MASRRKIALAVAAFAAVAGLAAAGTALGAAAKTPADRRPPLVDRATLPRTIVTTDGEYDDQNSFIRLLYYSNDLDIAGLVYSSANHHWKGDGVHTLQQAKDAGILTAILGERNQGVPAQNSFDQKTWRWPGDTWMDEFITTRYSKIYPNLVQQDPNYPTPAELWSKVAIGNVDFDSDMHADTPGSDLIKTAILDDDTRPLYLEAWGGTNTIARALKSIEDEYKSTPNWPAIQAKVNKKAVIAALGLQDATYDDYIVKSWPDVVLIRMGGGPGCTQGAPNYTYCSPQFWTPLKYGHGPLIEGRVFYGDGTHQVAEDLITSNGVHNWDPGQARDMATFRLYNFAGAPRQRMEFAGEGDSPTFMFLLDNGLRGKTDLSLGSWGGRYLPAATATNFVAQNDVDPSGKVTRGYATQRWIAEIQNDYAGRIEWGVSKSFADANHNPVVRLKNADLTGKAGATVQVGAAVSDPDGDKVTLNWSVYKDASTVASPVTVKNPTSSTASIAIPADARSGQRIVVVLTATDDGLHSLSRYGEIVITVD